MHVAEISFRGEPGPAAQAQQLDGARRLLRHAREVGGHGIGHVPARGILERTAEHPPRSVEQQQPFLRPFEPREDARLLERLGGRGNRLRFGERLGPPPCGARVAALSPRSLAAGQG